MNAWLYLAIAIVLEVGGTTAMKLSEGFTKTTPTVAMAICYVVSIAALGLALKKIEVSVAYAIWAGVGTAVIALLGILYFKEPATLAKGVSIALIVAGVVGLHLQGGHA
ncbi:MAG: hypothetical protein COX57_03040 [Alphaproteobacteria bacterium CG_4_10_14_0_2_um_filter_63_37]|nr:MAG: hypothetical protein AUJ55_03500 [Proteobacteria bacterium CG1_02_64_396]PJA25513.1 MAG: hypothetical protein COX57_03040 [Alphaproteobacteria bacterium CG_4_10_14_0_2_um_filter_63_37]